MHQSMRYSPDACWIAAGADKQQQGASMQGMQLLIVTPHDTGKLK
jgi:hypothetical protein